jgi:hypothetical protein
LQPSLEIEIGFAVPNIVEDRHARSLFTSSRIDPEASRRWSVLYSLPTTISGASGCFMPTIW